MHNFRYYSYYIYVFIYNKGIFEGMVKSKDGKNAMLTRIHENRKLRKNVVINIHTDTLNKIISNMFIWGAVLDYTFNNMQVLVSFKDGKMIIDK